MKTERGFYYWGKSHQKYSSMRNRWARHGLEHNTGKDSNTLEATSLHISPIQSQDVCH